MAGFFSSVVYVCSVLQHFGKLWVKLGHNKMQRNTVFLCVRVCVHTYRLKNNKWPAVPLFTMCIIPYNNKEKRFALLSGRMM